ncbi:cyclase family protein [Crossiella cryophila]|uniref:Kynurenine formamidase n=1 Tax=Crossiella cryophila TaxID=43355 RepID=A0A7W7CJC2_9PSEU|nr:cyclase family protein [Crossiella cryophila]MBB4682332.1 kynurenine formamidase [Crossiella cryophila]
MIVDLSHRITDGLLTYPGMAPPRISTEVSFAETAARMAPGVSFAIGRIELVGNTGTYLDTPAHFYPDGYDLADLPLERVVDVPAVVLDATGGIGPDLLDGAGELRGCAVLIHTGHSRHWGSDAYFTGHPFLTADLVATLIAAEPALVGIDSLNIDDNTDPARPAHHGLLGAGIPIVEHLTGLAALPARGARFTALPAPVAGMATLPVRAVAVLPD